jgi:hypothetical protein
LNRYTVHSSEVSTSTFVCGDGIINKCGDPFFTCTTYWPVYISDSITPFYPIPPGLQVCLNFIYFYLFFFSFFKTSFFYEQVFIYSFLFLEKYWIFFNNFV